MKDQFGRDIRYLRISVTDRCNLRCRYCMPKGVVPLSHDDILRYGEILRLVRLFAGLGISHIRVTGGEPLVRRNLASFIAELKSIPGIEKVSITSNGVLLPQYGEALKEAGLDSVNISLDTTDEALSRAISGSAGVVESVERSIALMGRLHIPVKLNAVLLRDTVGTIPDLAEYARRGVPVRFIELMPMGHGKDAAGLPADQALAILRHHFPDLHPVETHLGSGPAHYYESSRLAAPVGIIDAVSHRFCQSCNRVRLTSTGMMKPCLCYDQGVALGKMMRDGADDGALLRAMEDGIYHKPRQHCFDHVSDITENKLMSQIGG